MRGLFEIVKTEDNKLQVVSIEEFQWTEKKRGSGLTSILNGKALVYINDNKLKIYHLETKKIIEFDKKLMRGRVIQVRELVENYIMVSFSIGFFTCFYIDDNVIKTQEKILLENVTFNNQLLKDTGNSKIEILFDFYPRHQYLAVYSKSDFENQVNRNIYFFKFDFFDTLIIRKIKLNFEISAMIFYNFNYDLAILTVLEKKGENSIIHSYCVFDEKVEERPNLSEEVEVMNCRNLELIKGSDRIVGVDCKGKVLGIRYQDSEANFNIFYE